MWSVEMSFDFISLSFIDLPVEVIDSIKKHVQYDLALYKEGMRIFEEQRHKIGKRRLAQEVRQFKADLMYYHQRFNDSCVECFQETKET